jgi:hypothetical protein
MTVESLIEKLRAASSSPKDSVIGNTWIFLDEVIAIVREHQDVPVSLAKCSDAMAHSRYAAAYETMEQFHHECCRRDAKAVLEAAGVAYVE